MEYYSFEYICKEYIDNEKKVKVNDVDKFREKYVEILELMDIDKPLLQNSHKITAIGKNGDKISLKTGSYIFPESCIEFGVALLEKYTSRDFKLLRKANFKQADLSEKQFLIKGFECMMRGLGKSDYDIYYQKRKMDRRLKYSLGLRIREINDLFRYTERYLSHLNETNNYDDIVMLASYVAFCLSETINKARGVWSYYKDIRSNEITDISFAQASSVDLELENNRYILACALEQNASYQKKWKSLLKLISTDGFIKDKQARFNKLQKELQTIRNEEQIRLFGKLIPDEDSSFNTPLKHPLIILREAVEEYESLVKEYAKKEETEAAKTDEERKMEEEQKRLNALKIQEFREQMALKYPAPNEIKTEQKVFIESENIGFDLDEPLLLCCCKQYEHFFEKGASGKAILTCPKCHSEVVIDYKKRTCQFLDVIKCSNYIHDTNND